MVIGLKRERVRVQRTVTVPIEKSDALKFELMACVCRNELTLDGVTHAKAKSSHNTSNEKQRNVMHRKDASLTA